MTYPDGAHDPFTQRVQTAPQAQTADAAAPHPGSRAGGRGTRPIMLLRLIVLGLSACGMIAALALWLAGHGWLAARLVAGDVLLIFVLLLMLILL